MTVRVVAHVDVTATWITPHNLVCECRNTAIPAGTLRHPIAAKALSIYFIFVAHDGAVESHSSRRSSETAGRSDALPIFLDLRFQDAPLCDRPALHSYRLTQRRDNDCDNHQGKTAAYERR